MKGISAWFPFMRPYVGVKLSSSRIACSVSGLAKKVAANQGLQLQKGVGPDEKL